ncbi:hypothetical protein SDC9_134100 [bioreactor metagenome]|uniref:Uncharacterized protein n=1 Tax=bioreactor metagenome TaxID=1076179 RepID=A0A645DCQ7_9ZZZZ
MQVCPAFFGQYVALTGTILRILPFDGTADPIRAKLRIQVAPKLQIVPFLFQDLFHVVQIQAQADQKLLMALIDPVDVLFAVEPPIQDHVDFLIPHHIKLLHQSLDGFHIRDVTGEFAVIEW